MRPRLQRDTSSVKSRKRFGDIVIAALCALVFLLVFSFLAEIYLSAYYSDHECEYHGVCE